MGSIGGLPGMGSWPDPGPVPFVPDVVKASALQTGAAPQDGEARPSLEALLGVLVESVETMHERIGYLEACLSSVLGEERSRDAVARREVALGLPPALLSVTQAIESARFARDRITDLADRVLL